MARTGSSHAGSSSVPSKLRAGHMTGHGQACERCVTKKVKCDPGRMEENTKNAQNDPTAPRAPCRRCIDAQHPCVPQSKQPSRNHAHASKPKPWNNQKVQGAALPAEVKPLLAASAHALEELTASSRGVSVSLPSLAGSSRLSSAEPQEATTPRSQVDEDFSMSIDGPDDYSSPQLHDGSHTFTTTTIASAYPALDAFTRKLALVQSMYELHSSGPAPSC